MGPNTRRKVYGVTQSNIDFILESPLGSIPALSGTVVLERDLPDMETARNRARVLARGTDRSKVSIDATSRVLDYDPPLREHEFVAVFYPKRGGRTRRPMTATTKRGAITEARALAAKRDYHPGFAIVREDYYKGRPAGSEIVHEP